MPSLPTTRRWTTLVALLYFLHSPAFGEAADSTPAQEPTKALESAAEQEAEGTKPAPEETVASTPSQSTLTWWNRDITSFRSTTANLTPAARANDALQRITDASDQLLEKEVTTESAKIDGQPATRFLVGDSYLFSILSSDLDELSGQTLEQETQQILLKLQDVRKARIEQGSAQAIAKGVTTALIATAIFIAALVVLRVLSRRISGFVQKTISGWKRLKLPRTDLRPHFGLLGKQFIKVLAFIIGFYLFCLWIAFVFNQFPLTEPLGSAFTERLTRFGAGLLASLAASIPGLVTAGLILFITRWLSRLVDNVIRSMGDDSDKGIMATDTAKATRRLSVVGIWVLGIVLAYPYLPGSGSDAFKGISVLLGLMVSLGSSGMINQVMSGFVLLYSGSVRTGEYIKLGEIEGTITEMGILAVKLLTPSHEFLTIPNAVMITNPTTNYSRLREDTGVPITTVVTIGYDAPWRQVHELLTHAAAQTGGIVENPAPRVLQKALSDWYAEYTLIGYINEPEKRPAVLSELNGHIQDAFNEAGIQIMSPHYKDDPPQPMVIPKDRWFPSNRTPETLGR